MVGSRDIVAYALSHLGKSLLWTGGDALTLFLLVRYIGMAPVTAGGLFMILLLWNALCDVGVGRWLDHRGARGRPLLPILAMAVPVACLAFPFSLVAPGGAIWVLGCGLVFRTAFAVFDVPHNALLVRLADTPANGVRLAQLRSLGSGVAAILIGLLAIPMLAATPPSKPVLGAILLGLAVVSGGLMIPYLALAAGFDRTPVVASPAASRLRPPPTGALTALFVASSIGMVAMGAISKVVPHLDLSSTRWAGAALLILMIGRVSAVVIAGPFVARLGARRALVAAYAGTAAFILALPAALAVGGGAALVWIWLIGTAIGMIAVVSWIQLPALARAAPVAAESDRALLFGLFTMTSKIALGASGLLFVLAFGSPLVGGLEGLVAPEGLLRLCIAASAVSVIAAVIVAGSGAARPWIPSGRCSRPAAERR